MTRENSETQSWPVGEFKVVQSRRTWDVSHGYMEGATAPFTAQLLIHGSEYAAARGKTQEAAYLSLLETVSPALARAVTIARLVGGEL